MRILLTGGAGYIGSHTLVAVLAAGHAAHVLDDFSNASPDALERVARIAGRDFGVTRTDIRDADAVAAVVRDFAPEAVIHFAGLKAVGESVADPLRYFDVNVGGTLALLQALAASPCRCIVFSSSATVYGAPEYLPIDEDHPLRATNPYGRTKLHIEGMLADLADADPDWAMACLRYFNPVGAHASSLIGEDPRGVPNNLMPYVAQVAVGRRAALTIWGADYPTPDGTGVRDYVHVEDLAAAHLAAVRWCATGRGWQAFNIGTGRGHSVREMVAAFEAASGRSVPCVVGPRRPGDVAACWADPGKAARVLGWRAEHGLEVMCASAWAWQSGNPEGYGG